MVRLAGHVACMSREGAYRIFARKPEGKRHMEDLGIDGRIISEQF